MNNTINKNYKNFISLGSNCAVAMGLEQIGLRSNSYPFDWLQSNFEGVIHAIDNHFLNLFNYDDFFQYRSHRNQYQNVKYHFHFFHDFSEYEPLKEQLPSVEEKYNRRIKRFYKDIVNPTLFIRYIAGDENEVLFIESHYDEIQALLKSFNPFNEILFVANKNISLRKIPGIYVDKEDNDITSWNMFNNDNELGELFSSFEYPEREKNIAFYNSKHTLLSNAKKKALRLKDKILKTVYIHDKEC